MSSKNNTTEATESNNDSSNANEPNNGIDNGNDNNFLEHENEGDNENENENANENENENEDLNYPSTSFTTFSVSVNSVSLEYPVIIAKEPIQLSISVNKVNIEVVYVYQFGSIDFAFKEGDLQEAIEAINLSFQLTICEKNFRTCQCSKIYHNPTYVIWCMHSGHKTNLGDSQIWMDGTPTAFYLCPFIIKLLLGYNDIKNKPGNVLNPLAIPYSCISIGTHKFNALREKNFESQKLTKIKKTRPLHLTTFIQRKVTWLSSFPRGPHPSSLPEVLRLSFILPYHDRPTGHNLETEDCSE